jgi:phosphoglycerate dehydrogenase-like enzyme
MRILLATGANLPRESLRALQAASPEATFTEAYGRPHHLGNLVTADPDIEVVCATTVPVDWDDFGNVRWVHVTSAGVDYLANSPLWGATSIALTTSSGVQAAAISEWVLAMMLYHSQALKERLRFRANRQWPDAQIWNQRQSPYTASLLLGKRLTVLGYGSIGRESARLARAVGMDVVALGSGEHQIERERYVSPALAMRATIDLRVPMIAIRDLATRLTSTDYLVVTLPLTPSTEKLLSEELLSHLPPGAVVINASRGAVVDNAALIKSLREGSLGGAALDVFAVEPLPPDSDLFDVPNLVLTPHVAGLFDQYWEEAVEVFRQNLCRYVAGQPLLNLVDRSRGY